MVGRVLPLIGRSLAGLWDNILVAVAANAIWALSILPALGLLLFGSNLFFLAGALVLFVLITGPTTAGLYYLTVNVTRLERLELGDFFTGIKRFYRRGWLLMALNVFFAVLAFVNILFYNSPGFSGSPVSILTILWIYFIAVWFVLQLYLWPLSIRMEPFRLGGLFRNAAIASFKYLLFSLGLALFLLVLLVLSFLVSFVVTVIFGAVLQTIISNQALSEVLEKEKFNSEKRKDAHNQSLILDTGRDPEGDESRN